MSLFVFLFLIQRLDDFQSGYFSEFSEINRTGAKLWKATTSMVNADVSGLKHGMQIVISAHHNTS